jgi:protection-of-telomeres protein 1
VSKNLTQKKDDRGALSPFNICKYKANVRVVDYFPANIEDFAVGRRESEYDLLSDYSGGEDTDAEEDMRSFRNGKGFPRKNWEWRFALQVVDANPKSSKERMWLVVSNADAQMLFDLDAAE